MVGHRDTKKCRIQPLPQEVYIIILNGEKAGILHLYSAFKFTKYTAIHYLTEHLLYSYKVVVEQVKPYSFYILSESQELSNLPRVTKLDHWQK